MNTIKTEIPDVMLINPNIYDGNRGVFFEVFNYQNFNDIFGDFNIVQINQYKTKFGVLIGLHYQKPPYTQS